MSISCPHCKAALAPKELKPGKYQPKCVRCSNTFVLQVQWLVTVGTAIAAPKSGVTSARTLTAEERAARLLDGEDVPDDDFSVSPTPAAPPSQHDPNATGDFTSADAPRAAPRNAADATGDFTEVVAKKPASKPVPKPPARKVDPNATGDFTEAGSGAIDNPGDATGDFTEADRPLPKRRSPDTTDAMATGDFSEPAEKRASPLKPAKKAKADLAAEPLDADVPPRLGGYEVLKVLGKGGMGAVLLGRQVSLDRQVALKVMHPKIAQNAGFVARFTREAYAAAQLTHHNVVQIYDIGEDKGQHFFSMEFVRGQSLMELVKKEGKLAPAVAVGYVLQAARGLRYGHVQGMVHRDIKPDNLMINTDGLVKVADLGLVKLASGDLPAQAGGLPDGDDGDTMNTELTRSGSVMGTPAYMPPEQAQDSASVDGRADIYSLGCTLYVLVTGKPPFEGKTALEIISKHQTEPLVPPEVVVKRLPKNLSAIVVKMMAKKPEDRYQTMEDVILALEAYLGVDRDGPFNPKEEQADELEKFVCQFNVRSKGKRKKALALGFFGACVVGIVGAAVAGSAALAGGLLGLMVTAPLAYFVFHGLFTGGVVFPKARELVTGMKLTDWLQWVAGGVLFLATLFLFGLLWSWLAFCILAVLLGFVMWRVTDRAQEAAQQEPIDNASRLFKSMRLQGLDEEALRKFVSTYGTSNWEPFYEAVFGYEAKLAARAARKGDTGEVWKKHGTWREPVIGWLDARLEARRVARERAVLQKVEAKALEAEGVSKAEAKLQAEAMAADLVEQANEVKVARKEGKEVSVKTMATAARERRRPKPGFNIAGKKLRSLRFQTFVNDWLGRRLRFVLGAVVFAAGLVWLSQNNLLKDNKLVGALAAADFSGALKELGGASAKPLSASFLPAEVTKPLNSYAVPLTGLMLMFAGVFYFGWKPNLVAIPGAAVALLGPTLGVPDAGPVNAQVLSLAVGFVLIVVAARFLRA
jgi:serine/threonine protein kinase